MLYSFKNQIQQRKESRFFKLFALAFVVAAIAFASCSPDPVKEAAIELPDQSERVQTAFADDETTGGFTFTAKSAWVATVTDTAPRATRASGVSWLRLLLDGKETYSGDAGKFTLAIELDPNYTGEERSATITIASESTSITVTVTQAGTAEDGSQPADPANPRPVAVTGVTLDKSSLSLSIGDKVMLVANVEPADAGNRTVTWSSSNEAAVVISQTDGTTAEVTAVGEGDAFVTVTTQDGGKTDMCTVVVLPSVSELAALCEQSGNQVNEAWLQIDNGYSTYTSRLSLTGATPELYDFWTKSYGWIARCNLLLERLEDSDLPESEKADYKGGAFAGRATAYFFLKTLWGGVPLVTGTGMSANSIPRGTVQEVVDFIYGDINQAEVSSAQPFTAIYGLAGEVFLLQEGYAELAMEALKRKINRADFALVTTDTNGDGVFNEDDNAGSILVYTLLAEAYLETGNTNAAVECINRVKAAYNQSPVLPGLPAVDIRVVIRAMYPTLNNTGMKFLNAVRWGDAQDWGYRALMPIPLQAMNENQHLVQNQGW